MRVFVREIVEGGATPLFIVGCGVTHGVEDYVELEVK
jgi:hypothetical protein